jgi:hypothetical protein
MKQINQARTVTTYAIAGAGGHTDSIVSNTLLEHGHQVRELGRYAEQLGAFLARGAQACVGELDGVTQGSENTTPTSIEEIAPVFAAVYDAG